MTLGISGGMSGFWDSFPALLTSGSNAAATIIRSTQSPYVVPGTPLVANPAGTQLVNPYSSAVQETGIGLMPVVVVVAAVAFVMILSKKG